MKKSMMTLAAVLCCAMTTTVFTACGSDDSDDGNKPKVVEMQGTDCYYTIKVDEKMATLCDYSITYYGKNKELVTENPVKWSIKDGVATWEKKVSSTVFPISYGAKLTVKIKDNAQLEGVVIENICPLMRRMYVEGFTTDGKVAWDRTRDITGVSGTWPCKGEKLHAYIEEWEAHGGVLNGYIDIDAASNITLTAYFE